MNRGSQGATLGRKLGAHDVRRKIIARLDQDYNKKEGIFFSQKKI